MEIQPVRIGQSWTTHIQILCPPLISECNSLAIVLINDTLCKQQKSIEKLPVICG